MNTYCKNKSGKGKFCKVVYSLAKPQKSFTKGAIDFRKFLLTKSTSRILSTKIEESRKRFFEYKSGFNFNYKKGERPSSGFLLLSHGDPERNGIPSFELWDLNKQIKLKKWNLEKSIKFVENKSKEKVAYFNHPLIMQDESVIFSTPKAGSYLIKIDKNGNIIGFNNEYLFHHSLEIDPNGLIYVCITKKGQNSNKNDEGFAILDNNLNVLSTHFIKDIYSSNDLEARLFSNDAKDPIHINDVQPLIIDNKENIKNVLISLRSTSSILNYDIKNNKIIWILDGLTYRQHDVDILNINPLKISIFDNNVKMKSEPQNKILFVGNLPIKTNKKEPEIIYISPNSKNIKSEDITLKEESFKYLKDYLRPKTSFGGLSEFNLMDELIILEEENHGRIFAYGLKEKKIFWTYINSTYDKKTFYRLMWSRFYQNNPLNIIN